jgi:hypothetical protein
MMGVSQKQDLFWSNGVTELQRGPAGELKGRGLGPGDGKENTEKPSPQGPWKPHPERRCILRSPSEARAGGSCLLILATQGAKIRRIAVQNQPEQIVPKTLS